MILLRIVLWITLWITHFSNVLLSATNRRNSDLPIRKSRRNSDFLSVIFLSSYIYCYYLTYIYINRLSSSSLKAFNRQNRNNSDFTLKALFSGSKHINLINVSRPSAPARLANPAINPLMKSFVTHKLNLPISGVYSGLQMPCQDYPRLSLLPQLPPPNPQNLRSKRFFGWVSDYSNPERMCIA